MRPQKHEQERLLRQVVTALRAVPVLAAVYLSAIRRRPTIARLGLAIGLALVIGIGAFGAGRPATTVATPITPILPLTQAAFTTTFATDRGLAEPVTIRFSAPMDATSVAAAVTVDPATPITLSWDPSATELTIAPKTHWAAGTFHTVTVQAGALARSGQPLSRPARAVFLTRDATTGSVAATERAGDRVSVGTAFLITFARPIDPTTVAGAVRLDPPTPGSLTSGPGAAGLIQYTFTPTVPLRPDAAYRVTVSGVRDTDGLPVGAIILAVRTAAPPTPPAAPTAPTVIRYRPLGGTRGVARDAAISVRFSRPMNRPSTAAAFSVSVGGSAVTGKVAWAEADTVLVFTPTAALPYGTTVTMSVSTDATDKTGTPLAAVSHGTFHTIAKTIPTVPTTGGSSGTGGGAVGSGSWGAVETYYLGLMNCTRTGGWVTSTGACSSPGGRNVAALKLDSGISAKVSRPYAKKIALSGDCSHFIGGTPGDRLRHAGYTSYRWAENMGCRSGGARASVLGSHLFFQAEKSSNGGHYVNLMNAMYDRVGIGVWVSGGRVRLVIDFYHP